MKVHTFKLVVVTEDDKEYGDVTEAMDELLGEAKYLNENIAAYGLRFFQQVNVQYADIPSCERIEKEDLNESQLFDDWFARAQREACSAMELKV